MLTYTGELTFDQLLTCETIEGNGFIEDKELDSFLRELSSTNSENGAELIPESILADIKQAFMDAYDENGDGKISVQEMAEILPTEENFLVLFRRESALPGTDFMKVCFSFERTVSYTEIRLLTIHHSRFRFSKTWTEFDKDKSGFIESDELKSFLVKVFETKQVNAVDEDKLNEYTDTIVGVVYFSFFDEIQRRLIFAILKS